MKCADLRTEVLNLSIFAMRQSLTSHFADCHNFSVQNHPMYTVSSMIAKQLALAQVRRWPSCRNTAAPACSARPQALRHAIVGLGPLELRFGLR